MNENKTMSEQLGAGPATAEAAGSSSQKGIGSHFADQVNDRPEPDGRRDDSPLLNCEDFSVFYGDFEAVKDVSLEVPRKEVTAIIGPSGCGKSTFIKSINRMTDLIDSCHTEGDMWLDGEHVYAENVDVVSHRRRIGMVFQKPNPFPKSIRKNITYGPQLRGWSGREDMDELVEKTLKEAALWDEVKDRLDSDARDLSGGQQQRLCIARALAIDPQVVLLDEPTSALDPGAMRRIEELIKKLRGDYTILIITHNMQQAARISDYTAFLYEGELIEFNDTDQLFVNPEQEMTARYITGRFG